jgi:hypothetical protein
VIGVLGANSVPIRRLSPTGRCVKRLTYLCGDVAERLKAAVC